MDNKVLVQAASRKGHIVCSGFLRSFPFVDDHGVYVVAADAPPQALPEQFSAELCIFTRILHV